MKSNFSNTVRSPHRLIGITNRNHMIKEELKDCPVKFRVEGERIIFELKQENKPLELLPEQLVTSLFTKFSQICTLNSVTCDSLFITIQSFLNNGEREAIKACAQAAGFKNVGLIEEWEAILSEYYYVRQSEIENLVDDQAIIFIDFGYSHLGIHACSIGRNNLGLIDQEYLRYSGAKNIDSLLVDFYIDMVKKETGTNLRDMPKSLVKLQ